MSLYADLCSRFPHFDELVKYIADNITEDEKGYVVTLGDDYFFQVGSSAFYSTYHAGIGCRLLKKVKGRHYRVDMKMLQMFYEEWEEDNERFGKDVQS